MIINASNRGERLQIEQEYKKNIDLSNIKVFKHRFVIEPSYFCLLNRNNIFKRTSKKRRL